MVKVKTQEKMRLQKLLAKTTSLSRREAERRILSGEVRVNGSVVTELGTKVDPSVDKVFFEGRRLSLKGLALHYIAYNKPKGCIVTNSDPQGRPTIWEDLKGYLGRITYAGRLDCNSEGLIVLSNDGDFINGLTHPSHKIWKKYCVEVRGVVSPDELKLLRDGVELEDGLTLPARVNLFEKDKDKSILEISIREGRQRQVRRMCNAVGHYVVRLVRVAVGSVELGSLKSGKFRELTEKEVKDLYNEIA